MGNVRQATGRLGQRRTKSGTETTERWSFRSQTLMSDRAPVDLRDVCVETEHGSESEVATKDLIEHLLREHYLTPFTFTWRVRIDEEATPHSHPVLTLSTRFMVKTFDGVADYLHEQLHWFVAQNHKAARRADRQWRRMYGRVPKRNDGGAATRRSTRLHITVNWLKYEALAAVLGRARATETIDAKTDGHAGPRSAPSRSRSDVAVALDTGARPARHANVPMRQVVEH